MSEELSDSSLYTGNLFKRSKRGRWAEDKYVEKENIKRITAFLTLKYPNRIQGHWGKHSSFKMV